MTDDVTKLLVECEEAFITWRDSPIPYTRDSAAHRIAGKFLELRNTLREAQTVIERMAEDLLNASNIEPVSGESHPAYVRRVAKIHTILRLELKETQPRVEAGAEEYSKRTEQCTDAVLARNELWGEKERLRTQLNKVREELRCELDNSLCHESMNNYCTCDSCKLYKETVA